MLPPHLLPGLLLQAAAAAQAATRRDQLSPYSLPLSRPWHLSSSSSTGGAPPRRTLHSKPDSGNGSSLHEVTGNLWMWRHGRGQAREGGTV